MRRKQTIVMIAKSSGIFLGLIFVAVILFTVFGEIASKDRLQTPPPAIILSPTTLVKPSPTAKIEEIIPTSSTLVEDDCTLSVPEPFLDQQKYYPEFPAKFIGGGRIESGDFTFDLWLACDNQFLKETQRSQEYSEIKGLGIVAGWTYHGEKQEGTLVDFTGFKPFVNENSGFSPIGETIQSFLIKGIQFPAGIIPDFSQQDTHLNFIYFTDLPDGTRNGSVLTFTLMREPSGYRPVDIQVTLLSADELLEIEKQDRSNPPFATLDPLSEYPILETIKTLMDEWQSSFLLYPGWVLQKSQIESSGGSELFGGLAHYQIEDWSYVNQEGLVTQSISITKSDDGQVLQESVSSNGVSRNLTYGTTNQFEPYRIDFSKSFIDSLSTYVRSGGDIMPKEVSWQGKDTWMFVTRDSYPEPVNIENQQVSAVEARSFLDPISGSQLGYEVAIITPNGQEELRFRYLYTYEFMESPPSEVLALLEREFGGYQPPKAIGDAPPLGFDPSSKPLKLTSYPGDDFNQPSYWLGDIFAGDYLLGRVNFGSTPGGWCQRSADGSRIAFIHMTISNDSPSETKIQWLNLSDVDTIHQPNLELDVINMAVSWSPIKPEFAFTGCEQDGSNCGLYLLNTETNDTRLLSTDGISSWPLLWNPDGSQIALVDTGDDQHRLFVLDSLNGTIVYQGFFNTDTWTMPADSPASKWGITFPRNTEEEGGCFK